MGQTFNTFNTNIGGVDISLNKPKILGDLEQSLKDNNIIVSQVPGLHLIHINTYKTNELI